MLVVGVVVALPYAVVLLILTIIGGVSLSRGRRRPVFGIVLFVLGLLTVPYGLVAGLRGFDYLTAHLLFSAPAFLVAIPGMIVGRKLWRTPPSDAAAQTPAAKDPEPVNASAPQKIPVEGKRER